MNNKQIITALEALGAGLLQSRKIESATLIIGGAVAGMVVADMSQSRVTLDCDVLASEPDEKWAQIQEIALKVAEQLNLPKYWLNRDAEMYCWALPLRWRKRCKMVGQFGPLKVLAISRRDLMAMKLIGAVVRPQDLEDILTMRPTHDDIEFLNSHLDRLSAESLTGEKHNAQRDIIKVLKQTP